MPQRLSFLWFPNGSQDKEFSSGGVYLLAGCYYRESQAFHPEVHASLVYALDAATCDGQPQRRTDAPLRLSYPPPRFASSCCVSLYHQRTLLHF
jgi:hypothetical protein